MYVFIYSPTVHNVMMLLLLLVRREIMTTVAEIRTYYKAHTYIHFTAFSLVSGNCLKVYGILLRELY